MSLQPLFEKLYHLLDGDLLPNHSQNYNERYYTFLHRFRIISPYALSCAVINNRLDSVKYLHSIGINATSDDINVSIWKGHLEIVKYLHSIGIKANEYAMVWAARGGYLEMIQYLHSIGINKN